MHEPMRDITHLCKAPVSQTVLLLAPPRAQHLHTVPRTGRKALRDSQEAVHASWGALTGCPQIASERVQSRQGVGLGHSEKGWQGEGQPACQPQAPVPKGQGSGQLHVPHIHTNTTVQTSTLLPVHDHHHVHHCVHTQLSTNTTLSHTPLCTHVLLTPLTKTPLSLHTDRCPHANTSLPTHHCPHSHTTEHSLCRRPPAGAGCWHRRDAAGRQVRAAAP